MDRASIQKYLVMRHEHGRCEESAAGFCCTHLFLKQAELEATWMDPGEEGGGKTISHMICFAEGVFETLGKNVFKTPLSLPFAGYRKGSPCN